MIEEDYVSFETAKLLKEKGFKCEKNSVTAMYNEIGKFLSLSTATDEYYGYSDFDEYDYVAPTLQMAMKWLRNQHNFHIMVDCIGSKNYMPTIQFICNSKDIKVESDKNKIGGRGFDSFEDACEAAIKYCLENLI